jgi:hypothetical protein
MEVSPMVIWQVITTVAIAPLTYFLKASLDRLREVEVCLARTREQLAEKYATRADVHSDIGRVLDRLEHLDHKLDKLLLARGSM